MITPLIEKGLTVQAFQELRKAASAYPGEGYVDKVDALSTEFGYMCDYMLKGYRDDKRGELFDDLLQRMTALDYNLRIRRTLLENPVLKVACRDIDSSYNTPVMVLQYIEDAVDEQGRYEVLSKAFNALLVSGYWTVNEREEWTTVLVTANPVYCALWVAALSLSAMTNYCYDKVRCLVNVYRMAKDDKLRQRALVGAVLAAGREETPEKEADAIFREIMSVPGAAGDVISMQMQILACANAEADATEISRNIMPDLVKSQPFRMSKDGFVEKDEDKDSLDPDADERLMEAVKSGVDRMLQMQKNGSDVYFSGFSSMKRFPFFVNISNWFAPFVAEHPAIASEMASLGDSPFAMKITAEGPFCDSDKYSFVIAYGNMFKSMPENIRKLVENGEVSPLGMGNNEVQSTPAFKRLQFLQDMYRFFRLNSLGKAFYNPFADAAAYRPALAARKHISDASRKTLFACMLRDEKLWRHGHDGDIMQVKQLLDSFEDMESYESQSCHAEYAVRMKRYADAMECYARCLRLKPDDPAMMRGMARACYAMGEYAKASFYFDALHTLFPQRKSYVLNYAMAMAMDGMAASVVNDVYKLEYENPGDANVENTLGWVLLYAGKAEQAETVYAKLTEKTEVASDFGVSLNAFYSKLATGHAQEGVDILRKYCRTLGEEERRNFAGQLSDAMKEDDGMLAQYGIGKAEKSIIVSQFAILPL